MTSAAGLDTPVQEPQGRRPRTLHLSRVALYAALVVAAAFFVLPLYIMVSTSLKTMDEIRQHSALSLPQSLLFANWWAAWATACTGQMCQGISVGFINSVKIVIPATLLTLAVASVSGYALSFWRVGWAKPVFVGLMFGAFVPYQVVIYPLVRLTSMAGLGASLPTIVLVHTAFQLPIITLLFFNYFQSVPGEIYKAARVDGAGFWRIFTLIMLPMSLPIMVVAVILLTTHIWNDFILGLVFAGRENQPMTVQINALIATDTGAHSYNIEMAAVLLTSLVPLLIYFISGRWFVRGIAAGAVKG
jgi:glucose/mannose transport system permease protein